MSLFDKLNKEVRDDFREQTGTKHMSSSDWIDAMVFLVHAKWRAKELTSQEAMELIDEVICF